MRSQDDKQRAKAVRTFCGKLQGRPRAERRPDLIQPLTDLFHSSADGDVRSVCVSALTAMAEDGPAPAPC